MSLVNWEGVHWLEENSRHATEIFSVAPVGKTAPWNSINSVLAYGFFSAGRGVHVRSMFDVLSTGASSTCPVRTKEPCAACHDFSRSWRCPEHPE